VTNLAAFGVILSLSGILAMLAVIAGLLANIARSQERIANAAQDGLRTARVRTARKD
jgi:hypothetical protein